MASTSLAEPNDFGWLPWYDPGMADPRHDWYLKQWLKSLGKIQEDVARDLGWNKAKVSLTANGKQPYTREEINEIAFYLNIEPFELLLPPERAMSLRQFRASAEQIVTLAHDSEKPVSDIGRAIDKRDERKLSRTRKTGTRD